MPLKESDLLGRRIEKLFVSAPIAVSASISTALYTCGQSPFIVPSPSGGGTFISNIQTQITAGDGLTGSMAFGPAPGDTTWSAGFLIYSTFVDYPLVMWYPSGQVVIRPGIYGHGTVFYVNTSGTAWTAGTKMIFTLYGWVE